MTDPGQNDRHQSDMGDDVADTGVPDEFFSAPSESSLRQSGSISSPESGPSTLGDYELIEQLGAGGMGVVYRARQKSADRIVALKVIRPDRLTDLSSELQSLVVGRFRTEARAAAQLSHDNIVAVHDVGEADGQQYFSMQLVDGRSLAERLREGPIDGRSAARLIEPIARAVQHAHSISILHRDLKPENILVERSTGRPMVADFGLAKVLEAESQFTHQGELLGTPQYMSPEQARDSASVGVEADIYAIGATLYHMVCGRPPFHAAQPWETIRQVIHDDPVRPRLLNPAVHRDLETICLKCMEKEPSRRYHSAAAVADELKRYQEGLPIHARPLGRTARVWRWCRRKPAIASLSAVAVLLCLTTVTGIAYEGNRARLAEADARGAVNTWFTVVSESDLLNQEGLQPLRRDLLQRALDYYQQFLAQGRGNPLEVAATLYRIGRVTAELDSPESALPYYRRSLSLQRQHDHSPASVEHRRLLGNTLNQFAIALTRSDQLEQANLTFRDAIEIRSALFREQHNSREDGRRLANAQMNLGLVCLEQERFDEATEFEQAAQDLRQQLMNQFATDTPLARDLARGSYNMARLAMVTDRPAAAVARLRDEAVPVLETLIRRDDSVLHDRFVLANSLRLLGDALSKDESATADASELLSVYYSAGDIMQALAIVNPAVPQFRIESSEILVAIADLEMQLGDLENALTTLDQLQTVMESILAEDPDDPEFQARHAIGLLQQGVVLNEFGHRTDAETCFRTAAAIYQSLLTNDPGNTRYQQRLQQAQLLQQAVTTPPQADQND